MLRRRIVKCSSCLRRFATASGQDLCPSCRPSMNNEKRQVKPNNLKEETINTPQLQNTRQSIITGQSSQSGSSGESSTKKRKELPAAIDTVDSKARNEVTAAVPSIQNSLNEKKDTAQGAEDNREADTIDTSRCPTKDQASKKLKIDCREFGKAKDTTVSLKNSVTKLLDEDESYKKDYLSTDVENDQQDDESCCGSENDDLLIECIEVDDDDDSESDTFNQQDHNSPDKEIEEVDTNQRQGQQNKDNDVCYICGTNLSGKSLVSRVAHMKRCSTKYGQESMKPSTDEIEDDLLVPCETSSKPIAKNAQWHGIDTSKPTKESKEKQSLLNQFFKAPVRSLTNVLMTGSRQASKKKADKSSKGQKRSNSNNAGGKKKKSFRKGSWASNNRRSGPCPSYKRIPGTDFLCDGFYYAGSLTQNYFLTHFHSDHYGGCSSSWSEGIIYCSVSIKFHLFSWFTICDNLTETLSPPSATNCQPSASKSWSRAEILTSSADE